MAENCQGLNGHSNPVYCIKFLCEGRIISLKTNSRIQIINANSATFTKIQVLNVNLVTTCSDDKTIKICDLTSGNCIKKFQDVNEINYIYIF